MGRKISICETVPSERRERRGRLRRIFDAVMEARQRDVERDIRRLIGCSDGALSDELDRRITEHLMRNSSFLP
jgi:hypothetical protein